MLIKLSGNYTPSLNVSEQLKDKKELEIHNRSLKNWLICQGIKIPFEQVDASSFVEAS